jgi:Flp pilus assembly protein CpaB
MRPKSMVLILIALGCGLIASIGISQVMERNAGDKTEQQTAQIYVATVDISAGEDLTASKIKLEQWPVDKIPEGAVKSPDQLDGMSPMQPLYAGEPLLRAKLGDASKMRGSAARIRQGYRVMAINVDAATAVAGLIWPGDHVDVMVYTKGQGAGADRAEAILENVEVFAVNDKISRYEDGEGGSIQARTVSLLVTREQAERLMLYQHVGLCSLSLRHPDELEEATAKQEPAVQPAPTTTVSTNGLDALKALLSAGIPSMGDGSDEPEATMEIIEGGSGKVNVYTWDDRNGLPRESRAPEEAAEQTPDTLPPTVNIDDLLSGVPPAGGGKGDVKPPVPPAEN